MSAILDAFTIVCLVAGCFFALTGAVGILRFPDFFTRLHPAGKSDSFAHLLIIFGLVAQSSTWHEGAKFILISIFLILTTPTATHAITRAAYLAGLRPWTVGDAGRDENGGNA